jgi:hypothetical protein
MIFWDFVNKMKEGMKNNKGQIEHERNRIEHDFLDNFITH